MWTEKQIKRFAIEAYQEMAKGNGGEESPAIKPHIPQRERKDMFGWYKLNAKSPPLGDILAYSDDYDHMFIIDTFNDNRSFTHWQELPRYPYGVFDGEKEWDKEGQER